MKEFKGTPGKLEKFVQEWIDGHEPDTFIKNEHGHYMYSYGPTTINLKLHFIDLLSDYLEDQNESKSEMLEVLQALVELKEWKDNYGKDDHYLKLQPAVWDKAKSLIDKTL